jgi:hypothetical protein
MRPTVCCRVAQGLRGGNRTRIQPLRRRRADLFDPRGGMVPQPEVASGFSPSVGNVLSVWTTVARMVRREGPAPSPGIPQIPGLSGYPTRLMDLPGGAAPPDPRYKGGSIAGSWESENGSPCRRCADFSRLRNGCITAYAYREWWASSGSHRDLCGYGPPALELS